MVVLFGHVRILGDIGATELLYLSGYSIGEKRAIKFAIGSRTLGCSSYLL